MDALKQTLQQFQRLFRTMSPSQRITLAVIPLMIAGALFFLMRSGSSSYVPLSLGKTFTTDEIAGVQQTLAASGLNDFRVEGQQILVPRSQVDRYNAALAASGGMPSGWASDWEKKFNEQSGPFTSSQNLGTIKEIALAKQLEKIVRAVPGIGDASVLYTDPKRRGWGSKAAPRTATVSVKPKGGRELPMPVIDGIRHTVAGAIDGLNPEDVVVFDQNKGYAYRPEKPNDPYNAEVLVRIQRFTRFYEEQISNQLSWIPGAIVTASVELDSEKSHIRQKRVFNPKTVAVKTEESSKSNESSQNPIGTEPGVKANNGNALPPTATRESTKSLDTATLTDAVPIDATQEVVESVGLMPTSVKVSVLIPDEYYRSAVEKKTELAGTPRGTTEEETKKFRDAVTAALPAFIQETNAKIQEAVNKVVPLNLQQDAVTVASFVAGEADIPEADMPLTRTIGNILSEWGGVAGLTLFALWALRMVGRSAPSKQHVQEAGAEPTASKPAGATPQESEETAAEPTKRDKLQVMVRDNPEMAAAVLSRWMRSGS